MSQEPDIQVLQARHENLNIWHICKWWSHCHNPTVHPQGKNFALLWIPMKSNISLKGLDLKPEVKESGWAGWNAISNNNFLKMQITVFIDGHELYIWAERLSVYLEEETTLLWVSGNIVSQLCNNVLRLSIEISLCSKEILIIVGKRNLFVCHP